MYDLIKLFIENLKISNYAENTCESYEIHLRNFYSYCKQYNVDFRDITVKEILNYRSLISKKYSASSINCKIVVINSFYNFLIDIEETEKNPVRKTMYVRKGLPKPKPLNKSEKKRFFSYIETKEKHIELGFKLLFYTGIRISELVNLEKEDIKIIDGKAFLHIKNSKNDKSRLAPIFSLEIYNELSNFAKGNMTGKLFFYTTRAYQQHAEEYAKKYNVEFTTHMARHTFATEKLNEGMPLDILKEILGHADIRTTMYYAVTQEEKILDWGIAI